MTVLDASQDRASLSPPNDSASGNLLCVSDLSVRFQLNSAIESWVLRRVSFTIAPGKIVGLLGESGCGKTTLALSIMRLLAPAAQLASDSIQFNGHNLKELDESQLQEIRGSEISIIYQDSNLLNPVMRAGDQVMEVLRAHGNAPSSQMREEVLALFAALGLNDGERIYRAYPHQLSGGQRRRIAIAQALICKPRLVIADEPTAWLDASTTAEIVDLFARLRDMYGTAFLLISHDPEILFAVADEILVMYAGQIAESGPPSKIFEQPRHPYTQGLLACSADAIAIQKTDDRKSPLPCIPGTAPDPSESQPGCSFSSRCRDRMPACDLREPELLGISATQSVRCFKYEEED
jgi:oligopeptide/dipeptide ABC transporter ATP-binding protein